jgi:fibronectin-binding autotransporter adhesin
MSASRPSLANLKTVTLSGSGFSQVSANVVSVTNAIESSNVITSTSTITGGNLVTAGNLEVGGSANIADLLRANNGLYVPSNKSSNIGDLTSKATTVDSLNVLGHTITSTANVVGNLSVGNIHLQGEMFSSSGATFGNIEAESITCGTIKIYNDASIGGNLVIDGNLAAGNILSYHLVDAENGTYGNLNVSATGTIYDLIVVNSINAPSSNVASVNAESATIDDIVANTITVGSIKVYQDAEIGGNLRVDGNLAAGNIVSYHLVDATTGTFDNGRVSGNLQVGNILLDGNIISTNGAEFGDIVAQSMTVGTIKVYNDAAIGGNLVVDGNLAAGNIVSYHLVDAEMGTFDNGRVFGNLQVGNILLDGEIISTSAATFGDIEASSLTVGTIKVYNDAEIGGNLVIDGNLAAGNILSFHLVDATTATFVNANVSATATVYDLIITNSIIAPESNVTSVTAETATVDDLYANTITCGSIKIFQDAEIGGNLKIDGNLAAGNILSYHLVDADRGTFSNVIISGSAKINNLNSSNITDITGLVTANIGTTALYTHVSTMRDVIVRTGNDIHIGDKTTFEDGQNVGDIYIGTPNGNSSQKIYIGSASDSVFIAGSLTSIQTTNTEVMDAVLSLNKGVAATAIGAGFEILDNNVAYASIKVAANGNLVATDLNNVVDFGNVAQGNFPKLNVTGASTLTGAVSMGGNATIAGSSTVGGTLGVTGATTLSNNLSVGGTATVSGATYLQSTLGVTGAATLSDNLSVGGTLGVTGATTLSSTLGVTGASTLTGAVSMGNNATVAGTMGVTGATTLSSTLGVTGATTLSSTLGVSGASTLTGDVSMLGNATVSKHTSTATLGVTGAATIGSTLAVTGATTVGGTLGVTGATTVGGSLDVSGVANIVGATTVGGTLGVTGAATLNSSLAVSGSSTLTGVVNMGNNANVAGALNVTGTSTLNGQVTMNNNATVGGTLGVTGATTLSSSLAVTGTSSLTGNVSMTNNATVGGTIGVSGDASFGSNVAIVGKLDVTGNLSAANFKVDATLTGNVIAANSGNIDGNLQVGNIFLLGQMYSSSGATFGNIEAESITCGTIKIYQDASIGGNLVIDGNLSAGNILSYHLIDAELGTFDNGNVWGNLQVARLYVTESITVPDSADLGNLTADNATIQELYVSEMTVGTIKVYQDAEIGGNLRVDGNLAAGNIVSYHLVDAETGTFGIMSIATDLAVSGNTTMTGTVSMGDDVTIAGTLGVTGATTLSSTLDVTGASTLTGNVSMSNNATVSGTLTAHNIVSKDISDILNLTTANISSSLLYTEIDKLRAAVQHTIGGDVVIGDVNAANIYIGAPTSTGSQTIFIGNANDTIVIQGSTTQVTTTNTTVNDAIITLNKGGLNYAGVGIEFEASGSVVGSIAMGANGNIYITDYNGRVVDVANVANGNFPNLNVSGLSTLTGNVTASSNVTVSNTVHTLDMVVGGNVVTTKDDTYGFRVNTDAHFGMSGAYDDNQFSVVTITTTDAQASAGKSSLAFVREGQYVWEMGFKNGENDFYIHDGGLGLKLTASNSQSWSTPSDARIKKNVETIDNSLERVMQMRGVYYNYTTDAESSPRKVGVIAQETFAALPELVDVPKNEEDYLTVRYSEIACVLINAIKELKVQNDALAARVAQLEHQ